MQLFFVCVCTNERERERELQKYRVHPRGIVSCVLSSCASTAVVEPVVSSEEEVTDSMIDVAELRWQVSRLLKL